MAEGEGGRETRKTVKGLLVDVQRKQKGPGLGKCTQVWGTDEVHEDCDPPGSETDLCTLTRRNSHDAIIGHPEAMKNKCR